MNKIEAKQNDGSEYSKAHELTPVLPKLQRQKN